MARDCRIVPKAIKPRLLPKKYLSDDETLLFESRQHRTVWLKLLHRFEWLVGIDIVICFVIPAWPWLNATSAPYIQVYQGIIEPALFAFNVCGLYAWPFRWLGRRSVVYAVTDKRIIRKWGILFRRHKNLPLTEIDDVRLEWSPMQKVMDYGKLEFRSVRVEHGHVKSKTLMEWIAVPRPLALRRLIMELAGREALMPDGRAKAVEPDIAKVRRGGRPTDSQAATPSS